MIMYPVWEVDCGLVGMGNGGFGLLLWLFGGNWCGSIAGNKKTGSPKVICNVADTKVNVVHLTKLLRCLLVVAP